MTHSMEGGGGEGGEREVEGDGERVAVVHARLLAAAAAGRGGGGAGAGGVSVSVGFDKVGTLVLLYGTPLLLLAAQGVSVSVGHDERGREPVLFQLHIVTDVSLVYGDRGVSCALTGGAGARVAGACLAPPSQTPSCRSLLPVW